MTMKKYVCGNCKLAVGILPADFPFVCRCGTKYQSHSEMEYGDSIARAAHRGLGTELSAIFKELDAKPSSSCSCEAKAFEMDRVGIVGIQANRDKYLQWMRDAYGSL